VETAAAKAAVSFLCPPIVFYVNIEKLNRVCGLKEAKAAGLVMEVGV
jgi:hypothetical protein